jgi:hypothetical protein
MIWFVSLRRCGSCLSLGLPAALIAYLRRCDCTAEECAPALVEAEPPPRQGERALARLALDAYAGVWRAMHPEVKAELHA